MYHGSLIIADETGRRVRKLKVDLPNLTNQDIYEAGVGALEARQAAGEFAECEHNTPKQITDDPEVNARRKRVAETLKFRRPRAIQNGCPHMDKVVAEVTRRIMASVKLPGLEQA